MAARFLELCWLVASFQVSLIITLWTLLLYGTKPWITLRLEDRLRGINWRHTWELETLVWSVLQNSQISRQIEPEQWSIHQKHMRYTIQLLGLGLSTAIALIVRRIPRSNMTRSKRLHKATRTSNWIDFGPQFHLAPRDTSPMTTTTTTDMARNIVTCQKEIVVRAGWLRR